MNVVTRSRRVWCIALVAVPLLLAGCGETTAEPSAPVGGDAPTTPASLAYVAAQYVGEPDSAREGSNWASAFDREPLQAELTFGPTGEYDGDAVQVIVGRAFREPISTCARLPYQVSGCADLTDGLLYWDEAAPEEDAGGVFVVRRKGDVTVLVAYYGPAIKGDPREQDLPIEVQMLIDLTADARIDLTTTEGAVEDGALATYWRS